MNHAASVRHSSFHNVLRYIIICGVISFSVSILAAYKTATVGAATAVPLVCWHTTSHPILCIAVHCQLQVNQQYMAEYSNRWSEVVPPHTALSFAALWDPEEGMVTFSGGHLLESDLQSSNHYREIPRDVYDGQSAVLTTDGLTLLIPNSILGAGMHTRVPTVTFAFNATDDAQSTLDPFLRSVAERRLRAQEARQPSAYLDWAQVRSVGRTIYSLARAPLERGIFGSNKSNSNERKIPSSDDGFFEEMPLTAGTGTFSSPPVLVNMNLKSAFSMTTTSSTGYIDIDTPSVYSYTTTVRETSPSEAWSTLRGFDFGSCPNRPVDRGRRLQKRRRGLHVHIPADPAEVLARPTYNHVSAQPSSVEANEAKEIPLARQCLRRFKSLPKLPRPSPTTTASSSSSPTKSSLPAATPTDSLKPPPLPSLCRTTTTVAAQPYVAHHDAKPLPPTCTCPSPFNPDGGRGRPQLRRQKSMAKVVIDSVGRLTSKCRPARSNTGTTGGASRTSTDSQGPIYVC